MRLRIVRLTQAKFTVSAAAVIVNEKQEVLLLNHVLRPFSGWGLPGGFIDYGEDSEQAIRREVREEVGIEVENLRMIRVRTVNAHIEVLFTARPVGVAEIKSREIFELGWFRNSNLPDSMSSAQKQIIGEVLEQEI
ncbi:MAG: NUDIX hydrolase [Blastocatellia bacterium]